MFHDFAKVYTVGLERCGLQTCALPQTVLTMSDWYASGNRGTLEQMVFLPCPSMTCVFHALGTRVEQIWNRLAPWPFTLSFPIGLRASA